MERFIAFLLIAAVGTSDFEEFEELTNHLPTDLPAEFQCDGAETRIIGGVTAAVNTWAFMVQIETWKSKKKAQKYPNYFDLCGGSIIHDQWVMTAAHCCEDKGYFKLHFGANQEKSDFGYGFFTMMVESSEIYLHPGWKNGKKEETENGNDFCLIRLPKSIKYMEMRFCPDNTCATPVCLPTESARPGAACWVAGWGLYHHPEYDDELYYPNNLQSVGVNIFSEDYLKAKSKSALLKDINFENEFAAGLPDTDDNGFTDAGSDACFGDSGGPLVCRNGDNLVVHGVTSWGIGCGEEGLAGVYAKVFAAMPWIQKTIGIGTTTTTAVPNTKSTESTSTTVEPTSECPRIIWKGRETTKILFKGNENGKLSYILRLTIVNSKEGHPDIRAGPYTGFLMFGMKYCGEAFFEGLASGQIHIGLFDHDDDYEVKDTYVRRDGVKGNSVTFQYFQHRLGMKNMPWAKKYGRNQRKDQIIITISEVPPTFNRKNAKKCFSIMHGVLPTGYSNEKDWTKCTSKKLM